MSESEEKMEIYKNCPWGKGEGHRNISVTSNGIEHYSVVCECGAEGPVGKCEQEAMELWNHRAPAKEEGWMDGLAESILKVLCYCFPDLEKGRDKIKASIVKVIKEHAPQPPQEESKP